MTGRDLKQWIKEALLGGQDCSQSAVVEIVVGDRLRGYEEKAEDVGPADLAVSVVFKPNSV